MMVIILVSRMVFLVLLINEYFRNRFSFIILEIIYMKDSSQEIRLYFEFHLMNVYFCNFNFKGQLILFCTTETRRGEKINIVCVYSIQNKTTKCQKIYKIPKEAEVIGISRYDKIWLRLDNNIYEWNLRSEEHTSEL